METQDPAVRKLTAPPRAGRRGSRIPPLLHDRAFRRYWTGQTISMFGDQVSSIVLPLVAVLTLHVSAAQMGLLTALVWLPSLLFALSAGAWVDRRGRRRVTMIVADLCRAALLASVPASYALGVLTIGQLYAVAFGTGTFSVLFTVCQPALFVALVPGDQYVDGNSLVYGSRALSFLGSAYFLSRIRPAETPPGATGRGALTAGARFIRHSAVVRASLTAIAVVNFFMFVFSAVFVLYAVRSLHVRPGLLGLILGAGAIGGFLAALVTKRLAARLGAGRLYTAGCLLYTAPLVLVPLAAGREPVILGMLLAALFISGFGVMALDISIGAIFAVVIPDQLRSRVTGAFQTVNYGSRPLGALGFVLLLPSALPRFRMPPGGGQGAAELEASAAG